MDGDRSFLHDAGQMEANEVGLFFENACAYSIPSITPSAPGHASVISKQHVLTLDKLEGKTLEDFVAAVPATHESICEIFRADPAYFQKFYESIIQLPPINSEMKEAKRMLTHEHLLVVPDPLAYITGRNIGECAGQMVPHLHEHVVPRRGRGPGVVTAFSMLLND